MSTASTVNDTNFISLSVTMSVINDISVVFNHLRKLPRLWKCLIHPFNQKVKKGNNTTKVFQNGILVISEFIEVYSTSDMCMINMMFILLNIIEIG